MKQGKYTEQIIGILKEADAGTKVTDLCRNMDSAMQPIITEMQNTAAWASAM